MTKLALQVDSILQEVYALGKTQKEFGGDKTADIIRVNELRDNIFDLFRKECDEIMSNFFKRRE